MITKAVAQTAVRFEHKTEKNADGTPVRCRKTGKCKVWVTRPADFRLPVKYGMFRWFYITPENAHEWRKAA